MQLIDLVQLKRPFVKEIATINVATRILAGAVLIDIREDHEWSHGHAEGAIHIGRGVLERDIEKFVPQRGAEVLLYCAGGMRSVLGAASLQSMGYHNVYSIRGGWAELRATTW